VDQVIAFGDSMNDKSMFEVAGLAIAMGNASDELKQYADEIKYPVIRLILKFITIF
jgi:hydroxymethylpyrimidine pyrophosphatase-like HAD family hydrolase